MKMVRGSEKIEDQWLLCDIQYEQCKCVFTHNEQSTGAESVSMATAWSPAVTVWKKKMGATSEETT